MSLLWSMRGDSVLSLGRRNMFFPLATMVDTSFGLEIAKFVVVGVTHLGDVRM
jgi:hypothetical protein